MRDIRGIFHEKKGMIKDRNGKDLIKADKIKKSWQEYTEELHPPTHTHTHTHTHTILMTHITTMVWSLTYSLTS